VTARTERCKWWLGALPGLPRQRAEAWRGRLQFAHDADVTEARDGRSVVTTLRGEGRDLPGFKGRTHAQVSYIW
jgi:hypothetical protein